MQRTFNFEYEHYDSMESMCEQDRELVLAAKNATQSAYAPYSNFHVGAAARLRSGKILSGSNIESEVFPATMCAERTLLYHAQACHADDPIVALAIVSMPDERECYPCGQCRQTLLDTQRRQGSDIRVIMSGCTSATAVSSADMLLPFTFKL